MEKIKQMVDVNTVIGDPVTTPDGTTVIPISVSVTDLLREAPIFLPKRSRLPDYLLVAAEQVSPSIQLPFWPSKTEMYGFCRLSLI